MKGSFKKCFFALSVIALSGVAFAGQPNSENVRRDQASYLGDDGSYVLRITSSGHMFSENASRNRLGDTTYPWGGVVVGSGVLNVKDYFSDTPTASSSTYKSLGFTVSTATLISAGTTFAAIDFTANGDVPRNIVIIGTYTNANQSFSATATVSGVNALGIPATEGILFTTTSATGNVAWSKINTVVVVVSSISAAATNGVIYVGTGNKIGLSNAIGSVGNVYKLLEVGANVAPTSTIFSATYNTATFTSAPNAARDYDVWYHAERSPLLAAD